MALIPAATLQVQEGGLNMQLQMLSTYLASALPMAVLSEC
jgi:hypothetical protein